MALRVLVFYLLDQIGAC